MSLCESSISHTNTKLVPTVRAHNVLLTGKRFESGLSELGWDCLPQVLIRTTQLLTHTCPEKKMLDKLPVIYETTAEPDKRLCVNHKITTELGKRSQEGVLLNHSV